jgi:hypothetical protein
MVMAPLMRTASLILAALTSLTTVMSESMESPGPIQVTPLSSLILRSSVGDTPETSLTTSPEPS